MRLSPVTLFAASSVGAFLLTTAGVSSAYYRQWTSATCAASNGSALYVDAAGVYQNTAAAFDIVCDTPDDSTYMKNTAVALNVYGYDGSSTDSITAYACVTYRNSNGGYCGFGAVTGPSYVGNFDLPLSPSAWQLYPSEIAYVSVNLPRYGYGRVRGFRATW